MDLAADEAPPEVEEFVERDPTSIPPDEGDMTRAEWEAGSWHR